MDNLFDLSTNEKLLLACKNGIISMDSIEAELDAMERRELLALHTHKIWEKDGKYCTIIMEDGQKKVRRRNTREALDDYLISFYRKQQECIYIRQVFYEWINEKLLYKEIRKQSYDRYENDYNRFFVDTWLEKKKFKNITDEDLEKFIKETISSKALSNKAYSGLVTLIKGIFKYAKKKHYTTISITNFFGDLQLSKSIFYKKEINPEEEIFMEDEIPIIIEYLKKHADIWNLGILLQFTTGERIGEISALKKEDIKIAGIVRIRRTEAKYRDESGHWKLTVQDMPKTDAGCREVATIDTADWAIKEALKLNPEGEFLFMNKGKRIRGNTFNKRLDSICKELNIPHRTTHKIRRTYGTGLLDGGVPESVVTSQMGHTNIATTKEKYYRDNKSSAMKREMINKAVKY